MDVGKQTRPAWSDLALPARLFRVAHAVWGAFNVVALAHIWTSAITGRRDRRLVGSTGLLLAEGAALVVGRGSCPFGPLQARLGDPVPMFELVLPPRAAKAAIPVLAVVTVTGLVTVGISSIAAARAGGRQAGSSSPVVMAASFAGRHGCVVGCLGATDRRRRGWQTGVDGGRGSVDRGCPA